MLADLAVAVDAVFCNLRGDLPARLGLTYADLRHANPRIVCCSLSAARGARAPRRAPATTPSRRSLGWMSLTGAPDDPPTKSGLSLVLGSIDPATLERALQNDAAPAAAAEFAD